MTIQGMNPALVRAAADDLDNAASSLQAIVGSVNGSVSHMSAGWFGHDVDQLVHRWQRSSRPVIETLAQHIHMLAKQARHQAHDQDVASGPPAMGSGLPPVAALGAALGGFPGSNTLVGLTPGLLAGLPGAAMVFLRDGKSWSSSGHAHAETRRGVSGSGTLNGVPVSGDAYAMAYADADYSAHARLSRHGAEAAAAASVGVGVAAAANGRIGNDFASASGHVGASAEARAEAEGKASVGRDGAQAHGQVKAFAGAQANASARGEVAGVGSTAGVTGYAGAGVEAHADAKVTAHEMKASVHVGAAVGLGVGFTVSVDIKPDEVIKNIKHIHLW